MATPPSAPKRSKRKDIGDVFKRQYDKLKDVLQTSADSSSMPSAKAISSSPSPAPTDPIITPIHGASSSQAKSTRASAPDIRSTTTTSPRLESTALAPTNQSVEGRSAARSGLGVALKILESSAELFPPLKSVVGEFAATLDTIQAASENDEEYEGLTSELTTMVVVLNQYLAELNPEDPSDSAALIARSIEEEVAQVRKLQNRAKGRRIFESIQDRDDVIKRYRRVEGLFRQLQSDIGLRTLKTTNQLQLKHMTDLLRGMSPVEDALHDSSYSTTIKRRGCTAKTREEVQSDLQKWVENPHGAQVYWMNGMAGTGKTTIAYSLCEWLRNNRRLGGSFFCSRASSSCRNVNSILPTIAYQLAWYSPSFRSALCKILESDPSDSKRNVVKQFEKLIQEPMEEAKDAIPGGVVVVVDALDECEDDYGVRLILGTIIKLGSKLPLKFFVTSRPEPAIRDNMLSSGILAPSILHLHDIEQSIVEEDIKKFLTEAFELMSPAPSDRQIEQLAKLAGKLFIYAATVVRYVLPGKGPANSFARLNAMLQTEAEDESQRRPTKKYKQLDELYYTILSAAFNDDEMENEEIEAMQLVLWTVVCAKEPMTVSTLATFLSISEQQVSSVLQPLLSVLHISEPNGLVSTLHASFPDYMLDQSRSGNFYCDKAKHSKLLADGSFDLMKKQLRFNICGLASSFLFDKDILDLGQRIQDNISPALSYACRYWGEHLRLVSGSDTLREKLAGFMAQHLLFWMEVLNLTKHIVDGATIMSQVQEWLTRTKAPADLIVGVTEACDFVIRFASGKCVLGTPHIYISALPLCAKSSSVYKHYWARMRHLMEMNGTVIDRRTTAAQATWRTDAPVTCIHHSLDGTRVVSGHGNSVIRVWDARTGDVIAGPIGGHEANINSVAFSPDGTCVASGSADGTVRVWDSRTGDTLAEPFDKHTDIVVSVVFSPDGTRIASASGDETVIIWEARTGNVVIGPLQGQKNLVSSVAFSPDGIRIASGAFDKTVLVRDARTGDIVVGPLQGHTDAVSSIGFSPDGTRVVSGSHDQTIRLWDARTGDAIVKTFYGHSDMINSVAYSPDGTHIVSGANDNVVRIWDADSGDLVAGPLQGHMDGVSSVAFTPDSTRVISGSYDKTIRMWDVRMDDPDDVVSLCEGHTESVLSVAFSPNGQRIVSGSRDNTIIVWNTTTGNTAEPLMGHAEPVLLVAFSPDRAQVISGSEDCSIRLWGPRTSEILVDPSNGDTFPATSVALSPDGIWAAFGAEDKVIRVWDTHTGEMVAEPFQGHEHTVNSVAFSSDSARIVSGSEDNTIRVWEVRTGRVVAGPFHHTSSINSTAFSPDGARIVSGSYDTSVQVWDAHTGDIIAGPFQGHTSWINSVAFSPDGIHIAPSSKDRTIRVWNTHTGNLAGLFQGHTDSTGPVAFSPDGARIASSSDDRTIRLWDMHTGEVKSKPLQNRESSVASITPSEKLGNDTPAGFLLNNSQELFTDDRIFSINENGWVTSDQLPLFWVPPDIRDYVPHPRTSLVMGHLGTLSIDYGSVIFGDRWAECYAPN